MLSLRVLRPSDDLDIEIEEEREQIDDLLALGRRKLRRQDQAPAEERVLQAGGDAGSAGKLAQGRQADRGERHAGGVAASTREAALR